MRAFAAVVAGTTLALDIACLAMLGAMVLARGDAATAVCADRPLIGWTARGARVRAARATTPSAVLVSDPPGAHSSDPPPA